MEKLFIFTDGGAVGNPGPAAVGVVVRRENGKLLTSFGKNIGYATNNVAEYHGVIEALKWLENSSELWVVGSGSGLTTHNSSPPQIQFFLDSRLVVNQLNGLFKIKNAQLRELVVQVRQLEQKVGGNISYYFIPREKNFLADKEVKKILAKKKSKPYFRAVFIP